MRRLRWLIIIVLVAIAFWRLAPEFSIVSSVLEYKERLKTPWLALALLSQAGQYFGSGWLTQLLLKIAGFSINLKNTFLVSCLNVFAAHILPIGDAGVVAATFYFYRRLGVNPQSIIFMAVAWPIFGGFALLTLFLFSLFRLPKTPTLTYHPSIISLAVIALVITIALVFFFGNHRLLTKIKTYLSRFRVFKEITRFRNNLPLYKKALIANKFLVFQGLLAAFIYYLTNVATLVLSFRAFGDQPPFSVIAFAYTLSLVAGWVTFAPAGIGAAEATLVLVFLHFGVKGTLAVAAVLVFRLITFWLPIPLGALAFKILMKNSQKKT